MGGLDVGSADGVEVKWMLCFGSFGQGCEAAVLCGAKCGKETGWGFLNTGRGKDTGNNGLGTGMNTSSLDQICVEKKCCTGSCQHGWFHQSVRDPSPSNSLSSCGSNCY